jgi:hypothetical protein
MILRFTRKGKDFEILRIFTKTAGKALGACAIISEIPNTLT